MFSQLRRFQLPKDYLVQKGKAFKRSTDMRVDAWNGKVKVISVDNKGKEKVFEEQLTLPTNHERDGRPAAWRHRHWAKRNHAIDAGGHAQASRRETGYSPGG